MTSVARLKTPDSLGQPQLGAFMRWTGPRLASWCFDISGTQDGLPEPQEIWFVGARYATSRSHLLLARFPFARPRIMHSRARLP